MLVYKAAQVVNASKIENKPYAFKDDAGKDRSGTSIYSDMTVLGSAGGVAVIRLKGKTEDEVKAKVATYTVGKPADIQIRDIAENARGVLVLNAF